MTRRTLLAALAALFAPGASSAAEPRWRPGPRLATGGTYGVVALGDGTALILRPTPIRSGKTPDWERVVPAEPGARPYPNAPALAIGFDALRLRDGRALVVGSTADALRPAALLCASDGGVEALPPPPPGIGGFDNFVTLAPLGEERLLVVSSGPDAELAPGARAALLHLDGWRWEPVEAPPGERPGNRLVRLGDGRVLRLGGVAMGPSPGVEPEIQVFDPATVRWSVFGQLPLVDLPHVVVEAGGDAVALGENIGVRITPAGAITTFSHARWRMAALGGLDGGVILAGGATPPSLAPTRAVDALDPRTGALTPLPPLQVRSGDAKLTRLVDGTLLLTGGSARARTGGPWSAATWLLAP